jgi:UDP-N-acetylmuramoyl-L-alanyl-D-glutamate--2,6-diaminopimelate ligase
MRLSDLARRLQPLGVRAGNPLVEAVGLADPELLRACFDSRAVAAGDLFCALSGTRQDGAAFIEEARSRGAAAVLTADAASARGLPFLTVPESAQLARAAGEAAHQLAGEPSGALWCGAVTGTNGKTTVVHLVAQALETSGIPCARAGTLGFSFRDQRRPTRETTASSDRLHAWLAEAAAAGARACVLEASSHGIHQGRLSGLRLGAAAWTNLTHDHLDYHKSLSEYAQAKAALFQDLPREAVAFLPISCADSWKLTAGSAAQRWRWGFDASADLRGTWQPLPAGMKLHVEGVLGQASFTSPLSGEHNAENLLVAFGLLRAAGLSCEQAAAGLSQAQAAPGRLERVLPASPWRLFVDYAHTPDALNRVIGSLRASFPGARLGVVFGAGGDRDPLKRAPMGQAVAQAADWCIVTSDNPRTEDPALIAAAVAAGVKSAGVPPEIILDRRAAIRAAVARLQPGEVLLVAGKGHEDYQEVHGVRHAFDDRIELAEAAPCLA